MIESEQITKIYSFQQLYRLFLGFPIVSNWYRIMAGRGEVESCASY